MFICLVSLNIFQSQQVMEPVIGLKHNITQRASGGQVSSSERINVILESCVINDITFAR